jgi:uncharacterized protein (DUF362 family)
MSEPQPHALTPEHTSRRAFVGGVIAGALGGGLATWTSRELWQPTGGRGQSRIGSAADFSGELGIPGPYPGRVIEVAHAGSVSDGQRSREAVKAMMDRGMTELVGCDDAVEAWRRFFQPGDRVGIKVVPVGKPDAISSPEVLWEVIDGLKSAGVRLRDILVFERYRNEFFDAGYIKWLPPDVHWEASSAVYDEPQLEIDGQRPGTRDKRPPREDHVAGYDPEVFREMAYCQPASIHHPGDDRRFRSHLSEIITRRVDKFISIPVLKDHRSAGVTLALKNLSHGSVNNVCRSHIGTGWKSDVATSPSINQCNTFIPAIVSLPPIRQKAVLQILDGTIGCYEGGPGNWNKTFATWEYKSLFFATDPVALDHVGWEIIDAKRAAEAWPSVASMGTDAKSAVRPDILGRDGKPYPEQFHIRQPQHVPLAATLGLGIFDKSDSRFQHRRIDLA